jgi:hypothetical protein
VSDWDILLRICAVAGLIYVGMVLLFIAFLIGLGMYVEIRKKIKDANRS